MADIVPALEYTLEFEGGYSDDPDDHGGATNFGVTQKTLDAYRAKHPEFPASVKGLSVELAAEIYRDEYWRYDDIKSQRVATKLFDMGVNFGRATAVMMLQRGLGAYPDGMFGPMTLASVNSTPANVVLALLADACEKRYVAILRKDPSQEKYRKGWLRRARSVPFDGV